ncbi:MAG: hypothetical protein HKL90_01020 [Elusimicrobia bacterium]|nr:hypothetical protein [Elusimicrobiota bacterium]
MKGKKRVVAALVAAFWAACSCPAEAVSLKKMDVMIASAAAHVAAMEAQARELKSAKMTKAGCLRSFTVEAMLTSPRYVANLYSELDEAASQTAAKYLVCRALLTGDSAVCDESKPLSGSCTPILQHLTLGKVLATAASDPAGAKRLCSSVARFEAPGFCDVYVDNAGDPRKRAAKLSPLTGWEEAKILAQDSVNMGRESKTECVALGKPDWALGFSCMTLRAYWAAVKNGDSSQCRASGLCLALRGQKAGSCERYSAPLRDGYCSKMTQETATNRAGLIAALDQTREDLRSILSGLAGLEDSDEAVSRRRKIEALSKRCAELRASFGPLVRAGARSSR